MIIERKKILMVAYACNPEGGGEHWLGWGWALAASGDHDVWLLTPPNSTEENLRHSKDAGIRVSFVPLPTWQKKLCGLLGGTGSWMRKYLWQRHALRAARKLHAAESFDLVHQTTFHTFLQVQLLWAQIAYWPTGVSLK